MKGVEFSLAMFVSLTILECRIATPVGNNTLGDGEDPTSTDVQGEVVQGNADDEEQCHTRPDGVLDDRDMTLIDLARKLDTLAPNLTESEMDLLDELLDSDGCTEDQLMSAMERYNNGEAEEVDHHRTKRSSCSTSCNKGSSQINCSGRCKCKCTWFGKPKCKCCGLFC